MKIKKLLWLLIVILFLFFFHHQVDAQLPGGIVIPGLTCGDSEASDSAVYCCREINTSLPAIPNIITQIGGLGQWLNNLNQSTIKLKSVTNSVPCVIGYPYPNPSDPKCTCLKESQITPSPIAAVRRMCDDYLQGNENQLCKECADKQGLWTAIGCVYGNVSKFITERLLGLGVSLGGLIALLCIIYSAIQIQTSGGNAEKVKKAQESLTSCIIGLIMIIFSVFILRLIGISILRIPGLTGN